MAKLEVTLHTQYHRRQSGMCAADLHSGQLTKFWGGPLSVAKCGDKTCEMR